jgi:hypothetical protein
VTAEFAVALPALVLLLVFGLGAIDAVLTRMRCVDAARDAALARSRGADGAAAAADRAPPGAAVTVWVAGGRAHAEVSAVVHPLGRRLPGFTVTADATAEQEP